MTRRIYFAGSIRGGRGDQTIYLEIIRMLQSHGTVFTEHVGDEELEAIGEDINDRCIHDRDLRWLRQAEFVVAEVTTPSLGVGYEIGKATEWEKPVLCLYRNGGERKLSAMIGGCPGVNVTNYETLSDLDPIFDAFFTCGL